MATDSASEALPPCRVLCRSKEGVEVFPMPSERTQEASIVPPADDAPRQFLLKGATSFQAILPDGSAAFFHRPDKGIVKVDLVSGKEDNNGMTSDGTPFFQESTARVQIMDLSPRGSFLLTWERAQQDGDTPNLKVWNTQTGALVMVFRQKGLSRDSWPYVQWTNDEKFAFLLATNEIRVYPGQFPQHTETRYVDKLYIPGITCMSFPSSSPGASASARILFTSFIPKDKNKPSRASLYEYPSKAADASNSKTGYPALLSKSLFQAEEMKVHWSPKGDAALIALQSTVDTSGQSYYGSTLLFLMSPQHNDTIAVPLPQEGPVLDVGWMPNEDKPACFAVVAGRMPAMASLHNGSDGKATFVFGNRHQNTVIWAPHGRFLSLAGFGNLAGGMTFWDKNKLKQIPPAEPVTAACTVGYAWSPDSRLLCVSTTSPRMNVDNGINMYRYNGDKVQTVPWNNKHYLPDRLLQATFLPARPKVYPDRPQSPTLKDATAANGPDAGAASTTTTTAVAAGAPQPAGRYVPPSARLRAGGGGRSGSSLADRMRAEKEGKMMGAQKVVDKPKTVVGAMGKVVVGMSAADASEAKSKNAQRRERLKQKKEEEAARKELEKKLLADQKAKEAETAAAQLVDPEKRARKIKKTLKQIEELKQKDVSALNEDQQKKIDSEKELQDELAELGL